MRDGYFTCFEAGCLPVANTYARPCATPTTPTTSFRCRRGTLFPWRSTRSCTDACSARGCCRRRTSWSQAKHRPATSRLFMRPGTWKSSRRGRSTRPRSAASASRGRRRSGGGRSWRCRERLKRALAALEDGLAGNLAGGTHHAFADHGEGFCVLNDVAVAIRVLQREGRAARALVIDLDVHQGNGTAAIFEGDPGVFTFSMHGERNYPTRKMRSSLDVGLATAWGTTNTSACWRGTCRRSSGISRPTSSSISRASIPRAAIATGDSHFRTMGIRRRDRHVLEACLGRRLPVVITLAGGYAATPERTAELHSIVFREAATLLRTARRAMIAGLDIPSIHGTDTLRPSSE